MSARALSAAFTPRRLALVGASTRDGSRGAAFTRNLVETFPGALDLVHPRGGEIDGRAVFERVDQLPAAPDLAVIVAPPGPALAAATALAALGAKACLIASDVGRLGAEADGARDALRTFARETGMRIIGPGASGLAIPAEGLVVGATDVRPAPGRLALIAQGPDAAGPIVDFALTHGVGFSHVLGLGEMLDVDFADVLDLLGANPKVDAIVVHADAIPRARRFLSAARSAARTRPVIVLHTPEAGIAPARAAVFAAAFDRAGLMQVHGLDELFGALEALLVRLPADARPSRGDRLCVIANGRALAGFAVDAARAGGVRLATLAPETLARLGPLMDRGADVARAVTVPTEAGADCYRDALDAVLSDRGVDAVLVAHGPAGVASGADIAQAIAAVVSGHRNRPASPPPWVCASFPGGARAKAAEAVCEAVAIPTFPTPEAAVRGLGLVVRHRRLARALTDTPTAHADAVEVDTVAARSVLDAVAPGVLDEAATHDLLAAYNVRYAPQIDPDPERTGVYRLSAARDSELGPYLRFKLAGPAGRRIDPGVVALPPLTQALARRVVGEGLAGALLRQFPDARDAAALLLAQLSQIIADHADIDRIDLNPVWIETGGGAVVAAAMLRKGVDDGGPSRRPAIRPYPRDLEQELVDRTGQTWRLRPIRPEDEPALQRLIGRLDPEDLRLRFFQPIQKMSHEMAARLTQIDYEREMALVLTDMGLPGEAEIDGVVRLIVDPDGESAEYAVTVGSTLKGRGLGKRLMNEIIAYGRRLGLKRIYGHVLAENRAMLGLNKALGFATMRDPDDPGVVRVTLTL